MNSIMIAIFSVTMTALVAFMGAYSVKPELFHTESHPTFKEIAPFIQSKPTELVLSNAAKEPQKKIEVINLTDDNTVVMDQVFTDDSVSMVMMSLQKLSSRLKPSDTIYLVMNTPGGSVDAGMRLISFIKALPQRVKTLTLFSASMGFITVQHLDERLILDTGTLMSHRARFGVKGEAPGEMFSRIKWIMSQLDAIDVVASSRMGMSFEAYRELIRDEYWVYGQNAVNDKAADRIVLAKCGKGLEGIRLVGMMTIIGKFDVKLAKCPLIPGLLSVKFRGGDSVSQQSVTQHERYLRRLHSDKRSFVNTYITTNKWSEYQK